jgi:hypothetical protein
MLECFMVSWSTFRQFGIFDGHLVYIVVYFPCFGMLYQEKSGNPDCVDQCLHFRQTVEERVFPTYLAGLDDRLRCTPSAQHLLLKLTSCCISTVPPFYFIPIHKNAFQGKSCQDASNMLAIPRA